MNNNQTFFDNILDDELCEYLCEFEGYELDADDSSDIDDRYFEQYKSIYWKSGVEDIVGGDNFIDYCTYIFGILEEEGYYD